MKLFNFSKLSFLALTLALAASLVWTKSASAHTFPANANTNALHSGISRPAIVYHDGDTINHTVTVWIPVANPGANIFPAQQTNVVTTFTSPNGTTATLPIIAVMNPGETRTFTGADNSALNYVINPSDENSSNEVTASEHTTSVSHTNELNDSTTSDMAITTLVSPVEVPEFGFIPGAIALLSSGGAFLFLKKRTSK